jgi:hypothetical protein
MALDHVLGDLADAARVELLLGLGLERAELARHQHVPEATNGTVSVAVRRSTRASSSALPCG